MRRRYNRTCTVRRWHLLRSVNPARNVQFMNALAGPTQSPAGQLHKLATAPLTQMTSLSEVLPRDATLEIRLSFSLQTRSASDAHPSRRMHLRCSIASSNEAHTRAVGENRHVLLTGRLSIIGAEMTQLAESLNYDREVVRVWFCNKRQALKNTIKKIRSNQEAVAELYPINDADIQFNLAPPNTA